MYFRYYCMLDKWETIADLLVHTQIDPYGGDDSYLLDLDRHVCVGLLKYDNVLFPYSQMESSKEHKPQTTLPGDMKLHERAIWIAVPCLSPVNIQKFIPAFLRVSMVSGTPFCKTQMIPIRRSTNAGFCICYLCSSQNIQSHKKDERCTQRGLDLLKKAKKKQKKNEQDNPKPASIQNLLNPWHLSEGSFH